MKNFAVCGCPGDPPFVSLEPRRPIKFPGNASVDVCFYFSPAEAREIARKLLEAADRAEVKNART